MNPADLRLKNTGPEVSASGIAGPSTSKPIRPESSSMGGEASERRDEEDEEEVETTGTSVKRARKSSNGEDGMQRVQLACFYCRNKRIRCSGQKPICSACIKASVPCEWPAARRKKRTRKEMEEAKKREATQSGWTQQGEQGTLGSSSTDIQSHSQSQPLRDPRQQEQQGLSGITNLNGNGGFNWLGQGTTVQPDLSFMAGLGGDMAELFDVDGSGALNGDVSSGGFDTSSFWNFAPTASTVISSGQAAGSSVSNTGINASTVLPDSNQPKNISTSTNYVWPSGFTPEDTTLSSLPSGPGFGAISGFGNDVHPSEPTMASFMSNHSPNTDMRLINALENQAAFIEGNPEEDKDLELFYYRFAGSTAIQPGIHRISLKLQRRRAIGESPMTAAPQPEPTSIEHNPPTISFTRRPSEIFDSNGMPLLTVWQPLFELFLSNMSQHFPSVSRQRMTERFESGTMSNFLANCICACGARFAPDAKDRQTQASAPFIAKAQELIIPLVHLPTTETTTGLLFLAWANYGQNSESGLWQYSGMAIRMSIDLGIHENSDLYESPAHVIRTKLLFWTLFITDRIVAFATGRPASISEDIVEVPLPEDKDFFPDPSRNTPGYPAETVEPVPFVYFVRLMIICGRISNVLNGRRGRARTLVATAEPLAEQLAELQMRLVQFVAGLPESLRWSAETFRHQHSRGHGGCFLALHVWSHAVLALIYHPELLKSPSGVETPLNKGMNRNIKLSLASSRQICECMVFADLVAPSSYTSTPFLVQPLFVAAMAIIHEMRAIQAIESSGNASDLFLISMARQNLTALLNAISRMEQYWAGAGWVATILEKRSGFKATTHSGRKTLISLPDTGLLKRFTTDKDDPRDLAPATETSLRESIAKSERNNPSPYWLADLMAGYTVENMSFAPADSLDLERLLAGSLGQAGFSGIGDQGGI